MEDTRTSLRGFRAGLLPLGWFTVGLTGVACQPAAAPPPEAPPPAAQPLPAPAEPVPAADPAPPAEAPPPAPSPAAGFQELWLHDECTGPFHPQPDTCSHEQLHEKKFTFGGDPGTVYDVTLRVRGLFEPTTIEGGTTPDPKNPYFVVGGKVKTLDWNYWHIEVSDPKQTYYLNHYPSVEHHIYKEDYQATIPVASRADVVVRVIDGNTREIDNGNVGPADRQQVIEGVTEKPLAGQMLRLDVVDVKPRPAGAPASAVSSK